MSSEWDVGGGGRRGAPRTEMQPFFGMYTSKAEQILSRYRPIAPKPPAPKPDQASNPPTTTDSATAAAAPQSSSTSVSPSYRKGRKRSASSIDPALASPRVSKRAVSAGAKRNQAAAAAAVAATPNVGASVVPVVEVGALPMNVPCKSVVVPTLPSSSSCNLSSTSMSVSASLPSPTPTPGSLVQSSSSPEVGHESGVVWKTVSRLPSSPWCERIRVGRAAAAAAAAAAETPRFFSSSASPCPGFGCKRYEQFRQGGTSRTVASDLGSIDSCGGAGVYHSSRSPCLPLPNPADGGDCGDEDERPKLVTLSLLPDTPSRRGTIQPEEYLGAVSDSSRSDVPVPLRLSLSSGGEQQNPSFSRSHQMPTPSEQQQRHWHRQEQSTSAAACIDVGYLEQAYGASSDPVMLTAEDGSGRVLWANLAYKRVVSDRLSGKAASAGPYIDPLGLPTQLGRFTFRPAPPPPPPPTDCGAVLWGFLKKFMLLRGNADAGPDRLVEQQQLQGQQQPLRGLLSPSGGRSMPTAPQPVRPAASPATLCLECITEANFYSGYLVGSLDSVTTQLERSSLPALVTDRSNRVKWMNSAFNQLVSGGGAGVDDGSGILVSCCTTSTTTTTSGGLFHQHQTQPQQQQRQSDPSDEEKVCFTFETDKSPYSAVSLAGQMRLDLVDAAGRRSCLTSLACEMRRLDDEHFGNSWFVWKLSSRPPERKTNLSLST